MAEAVDKELRDGFKIELEAQMHALCRTLDQLIDMHDRYGGDTLQKSHLFEARRTLLEGISWFEWERRRAQGRAG